MPLLVSVRRDRECDGRSEPFHEKLLPFRITKSPPDHAIVSIPIFRV